MLLLLWPREFPPEIVPPPPGVADFVPDPLLVLGRARGYLDGLPPVLRPDPDLQAVQYVMAKEAERIEVVVNEIMAGATPNRATALMLPFLESLMSITIDPAIPFDQRQAYARSFYAALFSILTGASWEAAVSQIIGAGWTYQEHDPLDSSPPGAYTVQINLSFPPSSEVYGRTRALIEEITPTHIQLAFDFPGEGFVLDQSQLDIDSFGS